MQFTLEELVSLCRGIVLRPPLRPVAVQPVSHPSRLSAGACYFPIRRLTVAREERYLREKQPASVVVPVGGQALPLHAVPGAAVIACPSPRRSYFRLAAAARTRSSPLVIGITGSTGKSSTMEFLAAALASRRRVHSNHGGHNTSLDCCDLLLGMEGSPGEAAVIEMGFNSAGHVARMAKVARPHLGIITNISEAHLAGAGGHWAWLIREKGKLGHHVVPGGLLLVNADDPGCRLLPTATYACHIKTYGFSATADVRVLAAQATEAGLRATIDCFGQRLDLRLRVYGEWQAANAAAAVAAAHSAGVPLGEVKDALEAKPPPSHRFYIYRFHRGLTVIDDTFNATVASIERGLYAAARLAGSRRKIALLGGVKRLGRRSRELHRRLGRAVARLGYERVVLLRRHSEGTVEGLLAGGLRPDQVIVLERYREVPAAVMPLLGPDTVLYCKAENAGPEVNVVLQKLQQAGWRLCL